MPSKELKLAALDLEIKVKEFGALYGKLINRFEKYTQAEEIQTLKNYWDIAIGAIGIKEVVILMIEYFLKYKDLILESKVDELLKIDFAAEIKPGTEGKTANLIHKLIQIFKDAWKIASFSDQILIKSNIQNITLKAIDIEIINKKIETLN